MTAKVFVSTHPLMRHKLARLRERDTPPAEFRGLVRSMTQLLFYEAATGLRLRETTIETPLAPCVSHRLADGLGLLPILRAGLGMAEAVLDLVPEARVWHLGLYRDHTTHQPVTYYNKLPPRPDIDVAIVVDPMLATGGSAIAALDIIKKWGVERALFLGLIAAPEGVKAVSEAHPDVPQYLAALDSHLNDQCYIVPGLGDAGDRQFGT